MSEEVELKVPEVDAEMQPEKIIAIEEDTEDVKIIDDLTSIEREIAIMHDDKEEDTSQIGESGIPEDVLALDESGEKIIYNADAVENNDEETDAGSVKQFDRRNGTSTISELSDAPDSTGSPGPNKAADTLEHDDLIAVLKGTDDKDVVSSETGGVTIEGEGEFQIVDIIDTDEVVEIDPLAKDSPKKEGLTKEEERKLALEQFKSLERRGNKNRRRKQDIKSITQPADLVTSLVSDWSDGDEANADDSAAPAAKKKVITPAPQAKTTQSTKAAQETPSATVASKEKEKSEKAEKPAPATTVNPPKKIINTTATPQPASQPKKLINASPAQEKKTPAIPPPSPFKRTRIIKRKIIWDPDAPETQFSYAKLVKPSTPTPAKKDVKKDRATPTPKKKEEPATVATTPPAGTSVKRQSSETPTAAINGSKKKKFSEVDRLLGDEGAVNMLNSLEGERTKRTSESDTSRAASNRKGTPTAGISPPERAQTPSKKEVAQPKRRTPKPKASSSWDYVYKQQKQNDDSMIIRRRSNSSYSSSASINRLSVDAPAAGGKTPKGTPNPSPKTPQASPINSPPTSSGKAQEPDSENQFEFAKPENKSKSKKMKSPIIIVNPLSADMKKATAKRNIKSPVSPGDCSGDAEIADVSVLKIGNVRQVTFNTHRAKLGNTFTAQLMNELSSVLETLNDDSDCNAVLLLSEGSNFCQGIDFTDLALGTLEKRKNAAILMARAVKNFLTTLAQFRKPLIAGVNGINSGLGVTMLPLFDMVIGSDKGTYETPYAKIGQIPEGYYIFSESPKIRSTFKSKLLWLSEKLHSTESALSGLVNKLTSVTKVNEEALSCAKKIASLSVETFTVMKKRSKEQTLPQIITALEEEEAILVRQWCSAPCVDNFKHFIHKGQW